MSLEQAEIDHWDELSADSGVSVTYDGTSFTMVRGVRASVGTDLNGMELLKREADWIASVDDLKTAGKYPPQAGKFIAITVDGDSLKFQTRRQGSEDCFSPMGNHRKMVRIHTVEVKA